MNSILTAAYQRQAFVDGRFLRVVNWHNTPATQRDQLFEELSWYAARYRTVLPEDLDHVFDTGSWELDRPGIVLCFYDGYRNHLTVAAPLLDELGLTGWFFPPTGALDVAPDQQRDYARDHDIDLVPGELQAPWLMTWDDLGLISERHVIAAHTAHHTGADDIVTAADAEREVHDPVGRLAALTGRTPPAFAFLHGTVPVAGTVAGDAVLASGVRYAVTNTAYIRIGD